MKRYIGGSWLLILLGAISCVNPVNSDGFNSMSCTIDDASFEADIGVMVSFNDGLFTITGSGSQRQQCQLIVDECNKVGTYVISQESGEKNTARWSDGMDAKQDFYLTSEGKGVGLVVITSISSEEVTGTFSFDARNSEGDRVQVQNGVFTASLD